MKKVLVVLIILLLPACSAWSAGTATIVHNSISNKIRAVVWEWVSDASGDVSGGDSLVLNGSGKVIGFQSDPVDPTDLFDVTMTSSLEFATVTFVDILGGDGADLSNSTDGAETELTLAWTVIKGTTIDLVIANAGNAKSGVFVLVIWEDR